MENWRDLYPSWKEEFVTPYGQFILRDGRKFWVMHVNRGNPSTLFFIHGLGGRAEQFRDILHSFLTSTSYNLVALDLLGFGRSEKPNSPLCYSLEEYVKDCQNILNRFGSTVNHLVGHSMGSAIVMRLASLATAILHESKVGGTSAERTIRSMILVSASIPPTPKPALLHCCVCFLECVRPLISKAVANGLYAPTTDRGFIERESAVTRQNPFYVVKPIALNIEWPNVAATSEAVHQLRLPCLIVMGEVDTVTPVARARSLHEQVQGSTFEVIAHAGHNVHMEQPDKLYHLILDFVTASQQPAIN